MRGRREDIKHRTLSRVASILGDYLAKVLPENTTISGSGFFLLFNLSDSGKVAQVGINPANPNAYIVANDGAGNVCQVQVGSANVNLVITGTADLRVNGQPGADGERLTSSGTGAAPTWERPSVVTQASAPSSPSSGDLWFSTTDGELYQYDGTRTKWLSVSTVAIQWGRTGTVSVGHSIKGPGNADMDVGAERGWVFPWNGTVVGWTWTTSAATSGWTHRLGKYDDSAASATVALHTIAPGDGYDDFQELDLDLDFDVRDLVGASAVSGTDDIVEQNMTVLVKRRPSA